MKLIALELRILSVRFVRICGLLAIVLSTGALLHAQTPGTGAISGTVSDPSGALLTNARVTAVNLATGGQRATNTGGDGLFRLPLLPPATYSLKVSAPGFATVERSQISVVASETTSLSVALALAANASTIDVRVADELLQTESSTLGYVVDQNALSALPLSNRNFTQILALSPGVAVELPNAAMLGRGTQNVSTNGSKTTSTNIQFNGIDANNLAQNSAAGVGPEVGVAVPSPDSIEEFKVQTGNYDAGYGRGVGANVDLISRAGGNHFHGSAWEYLRNDVLNANLFFLKLTGQPRAVLKHNQFGGSFGGPIFRDKSFFFFAYQGLRSANGLGTSVSTFLPQLTSDRSAAKLGSQFCPAGHTDGSGQPLDGYLTHAGGTQVACNGSNISPVALALLNFKLPNGSYAIPSPQINLPSSDPTALPIGLSTYAIPAKYNENQYTVSIDHALSSANQLAGRFFYSSAPTQKAFSPNAANVPGWGTDANDQNIMFVLSDTHVFSPSVVNVARAGFVRFNGISAVQKSILATDVGMSVPTGGTPSGAPAPGVTVDGLFTIGDAGTPNQWQNTNTFVWQDSLALTHGRQTFRFGAEVKRIQLGNDAPFSFSGLVDVRTFGDFLVGQSAAQNGSPIGASNVTTSNGASGISRRDSRYTDIAAFFQDDIRLTSRLSVNAGLRYEIFGPPKDTKGRLATFDPTIAQAQVPAGGSLSGFIVPSNFTGPVPGDVKRSSGSTLWPTDYNNFSPRVGFSLQVMRPLVVRGGYGIYVERLSGNFAETLITQQPFTTSSFASDSFNGAATLQAPFNPLLPAAASYPIFSPRVPGGGPFISAVSPREADPYTHEYNLNLQYAFAQDYRLEVGYVGTRSLNVPGCLQFNQALLASPQAPVNGETTNSAANVIQRLPYQGVSPGSLICQSTFHANYNSLQTSLIKRLGHGLQFQASYTWAKSLDETSGSGGANVYQLWLLTNDQRKASGSYGLTDFDRSNRLVVNFVYDAPRFSGLPLAARSVLGRWRISGIGVAQSGSPLTIIDSGNGAVYGNLPFENRAQLAVGGKPSTSGSLFTRALNGYLDPAAFTSAPQAPNATGPFDTDFGNSAVGLLRGPGQSNIDLALEKTFPIREISSFRFRTEFFNLTNHTNFANPNTNLGSGPAFGLISATATNPRIIQFALKYMF